MWYHDVRFAKQFRSCLFLFCTESDMVDHGRIHGRKRLQRSSRVEEASNRCCDLLERFAQQDPSDPNSAWKNPQRIFDQLNTARQNVIEAGKVKDEDKHFQDFDHENFRLLYIDMITDAFADALESLRGSEGNQLDIDVLVDCLQSGIDLQTMEEKQLLLHAIDPHFDEPDSDTSMLNPHEQQRVEGQLDFTIRPSTF